MFHFDNAMFVRCKRLFLKASLPLVGHLPTNAQWKIQPNKYAIRPTITNVQNMKKLRRITLGVLFLSALLPIQAQDIEATLMVKEPGNEAVSHHLKLQGDKYVSWQDMPAEVSRQVTMDGDDRILAIRIRAKKDIFFHFEAKLSTGLDAGNSEFYLPGFWYHRNMRSPKEAPSFRTSKIWNFREDRLTTPLTSAYDDVRHEAVSVLRLIDAPDEVQTQLTEGEVILPGNTSVGYLGFDSEGREVKLTFGFPYAESPMRYIRKLTLTPSMTAFVKLSEGQERTIRWRIHRSTPASYGDFVTHMWQYCYDCMHPQPLTPAYTGDEMKAHLCGYFRNSFVDKYPLKYNSGISILTGNCIPTTEVQLGFCGRVLLNAFNEIEYGEEYGDTALVKMGNAIFDSFLAHGFTAAGYFLDTVNFKDSFPASATHSIRQQSEAAYAVLHYLKYEKKHGRKHKAWEDKIRTLLDNLVKIQKADGRFARKYKDDGTDVDESGGSTPSATSTLVMGWKYFGNNTYLQAAKQTADYVEKNIISKSDYFSSTLDANCEDKEAAIAAVTSTYYLAMATKGKERKHYIGLCQQAAYFAMSWYYTWDVPFASGQMLGDVGFKSRGWGNVSVENNHIDVFVFELPHIVKWLAEQTGESRFAGMCNVIQSSLCQLMPTEKQHFNIAKPGFYPEVVQHTTWDYGKNGKGFYNDVFAPGWTVASLWELYSPERTPSFFK